MIILPKTLILLGSGELGKEVAMQQKGSDAKLLPVIAIKMHQQCKLLT